MWVHFVEMILTQSIKCMKYGTKLALLLTPSTSKQLLKEVFRRPD